jgi:hypothetical protein
MATIRARKQADGSTRYTAIVRIRRGKTIVYREYKTFALRTAAGSWAKHREVAVGIPYFLERVPSFQNRAELTGINFGGHPEFGRRTCRWKWSAAP